MKDKLVELAEKVEDQESFLVFVRELVKDRERAVNKENENPSPPYGPDAGGWENTSIESYLEGAIAWAEDSQFGSKMAFPDYEIKSVSEWRKFAAFLMAGRVYE
ncbi:MAG: hypothetical protein AB2689_16200 [Candidatus Thiodiazotropha taylori]|jgi:hypothetical protein